MKTAAAYLKAAKIAFPFGRPAVGNYRVLYRETHVRLDELAEAVVDGRRKEFMEFGGDGAAAHQR